MRLSHNTDMRLQKFHKIFMVRDMHCIKGII